MCIKCGKVDEFTDNIIEAQQAIHSILNSQDKLNDVVAKTSRFAKLIHIHPEQIGNLIYLRLECLLSNYQHEG